MIFFETHGLDRKELFRNFSIKDINFPMHFHRAYELILMKSGKSSIVIDQKEYLLEQNDLAFIFPNQLHEFKGSEESRMTIFQFAPEMIEPFYIKYKQVVPVNNVLHLKKVIDEGELHTQYAQLSFLYALCDELIHKTNFEVRKTEEQSKVIHQILTMVEQNYAYDCTLKHISQRLQYDYSYLSKLFVQKMQMSFTEYLNQYRISKACYMIRNTQHSVGDIAVECGYNNLRTFHRNFKIQVGKTPRDYKND